MNDGQMTFFDKATEPRGRPVRVTIRRSFNAPRESVFDAWLIPYLAGTWLFGPGPAEQQVITLENSPLPGGSYLLEVVRQGSRKRLTGTYREIRRPEKLQCTVGEDSQSAPLTLLTLELLQDGNKTRMKLNLELDPALAEQAETLREQWNQRCKALAQQLGRSARTTGASR